MNSIKKYHLFTHTDLDGAGCAIMATKAFGEQITISCHNYKEIDQALIEFIESKLYCHLDKIFITDISIKQETVNKILSLGLEEKIILLDHHKSAIWLNRYNWCHVTELNNNHKTCGTELLYDYLINTKHLLPCLQEANFVSLVRYYDTWDWCRYHIQDAKDLNDLFYAMGFNQFVDWALKTNGLISFHERNLLEMIQAERTAYISEKEKSMFFMNYKHKHIGVLFAEQHISELGLLCNKYPDMDYIVILNLSKSTMSFRTNKTECDVSNIAKKYFNGGGHPQSSGAPLNYKFLNKVLKQLKKNKK